MPVGSGSSCSAVSLLQWLNSDVMQFHVCDAALPMALPALPMCSPAFLAVPPMASPACFRLSLDDLKL